MMAVEVFETDKRVQEAVRLIVREAALLDERDYTAWNELWADGETRYVIPIERDAEDFDDHLNLVNDGTELRRRRVQRMSGGYAHAGNTTGPTLRSVSRFIVKERTEQSVVVSSAQIIVSHRHGQQNIWASDVIHWIDTSGAEPRIRRKVVRLIDSKLPVPTCGFLL